MYCGDKLILVLFFVTLNNLGGHFYKILDDFTEECQNIPCRLPLRQRFSSLDIVNYNESDSDGRLLFKEIILSRCRPSFGCCDTKHLKCLVNLNDIERICIKLEYLYHNENSPTPKYILVNKHKSCSCQSRNATDEDLWEPRYSLLDKC